MSNRFLKLTLIQTDIVWEDKPANLDGISRIMEQTDCAESLVVLPEMFSTGFSMAPERLAEPMDGPTVAWMREHAAKGKCVLSGSIIVTEGDKYYNRMLWVQPDGNVGYYNKRHLFAYAGEHEHYAPGSARTVASLNGWRINLQVCYDLRFPVWARNQGGEYDVLLYVANWPEQRSLAWNTLLQARAIENQCFTVGVNRIGTDGKGIHYCGDSSVYGPLGEQLWKQGGGTQAVKTITLDYDILSHTRERFPFLRDADRFLLL